MSVPNPKFVVYQGNDGKFYFRLQARNGEVVLTSQGYASKPSCLNGIESVRKNSQSEARFEKKEAKDGRTYFALIATNGQNIASSQMYKTISGRDNGIASVAKIASDAGLDDETKS